jgi:hypothetical protein
MVYLDGYGSIPRDTIYRDEHPFASYFGVHHGYRVLTHIQIGK